MVKLRNGENEIELTGGIMVEYEGKPSVIYAQVFEIAEMLIMNLKYAFSEAMSKEEADGCISVGVKLLTERVSAKNENAS